MSDLLRIMSSRTGFLVGAAIAGPLALMVASPAIAAPSAGERLAERWCSQCHGVKPNQTSTNPKAPSFAELAAQASITEYSLRVFLRTPHETMPNFIIPPDEMDALAGYIMSLKPKP